MRVGVTLHLPGTPVAMPAPVAVAGLPAGRNPLPGSIRPLDSRMPGVWGYFWHPVERRWSLRQGVNPDTEHYRKKGFTHWVPKSSCPLGKPAPLPETPAEKAEAALAATVMDIVARELAAADEVPYRTFTTDLTTHVMEQFKWGGGTATGHEVRHGGILVFSGGNRAVVNMQLGAHVKQVVREIEAARALLKKYNVGLDTPTDAV